MSTYDDSTLGMLQRDVARGVVVAVHDSGVVEVTSLDGEPAIPCVVLETREGSALHLKPGDQVLLWMAHGDSPGVIMGRIPSGGLSGRNEVTPDTLVLEAKESLTLRVGEGSITIRADGKILIKGKDLVSHAKNVNRIKGGAVAIN